MLESRHLVGLFVLMVVIFGVVFVLGYELGRNQYGEQVRAATETPVAGAPDPATEVVRAGHYDGDTAHGRKTTGR